MVDNRPVYERGCATCGTRIQVVDYTEEGPAAIAVRHAFAAHGIGGGAIMGKRPNFEKIGLTMTEIKEKGKRVPVVL